MNSNKCVLCNSNKDDALKYGEFMQYGKQRVHYYCLLLSSNLAQRGKDGEGLLGFLEPDIKKEVERVRSYKCIYCKQLKANIACCAKKCQRSFHLCCGVQKGCSSIFMGKFQSFCAIHSKFEKNNAPPANETCGICSDDLGTYRKHLIFRAPCCGGGWFHRWCLAKMALNSGFFFKCPLCNNSEKFRRYVQTRSIFVPDRDAAWEREPNAFADLLVRPDTCSAEECQCRNGRQSQGQVLIPCHMCGSKAIHRRCATTAEFICTECEEILHLHQSADQSRNIEENEYIIHLENTNEESDGVVQIESGPDSENANDNRMNCDETVNTNHNVLEFSSQDCSTTVDPSDEIFSQNKRKRCATVAAESKVFPHEKIPRLEKRIHTIDEDSIFRSSTSSNSINLERVSNQQIEE